MAAILWIPEGNTEKLDTSITQLEQKKKKKLRSACSARQGLSSKGAGHAPCAEL